MRKVTVVVGACLALGMLPAPAGAVNVAANYFDFAGDKGTHCVVRVGARASNGISAIELPQVGFSGEPACTYAGSSPGTGTSGPGTPAASVSGAKAKRACKRKARGRKRHRCKRKRLPKSSGAASPRAAQPAGLGAARLQLIGPLGLPSLFGTKTLLSLTFGYACDLTEGAACADDGNLLPALPLLPYYSQFSFTLTPPMGETWSSIPGGCTGGTAAQCVLQSPNVTPTLL